MKCTGYAIIKVVDGAPKNVKTRIYKVMNGTTVTIKGRRYRSRGLVENAKGVKLANSLYAVPYEEVPKVLSVFHEKDLDEYVQVFNLCTCTCEQT